MGKGIISASIAKLLQARGFNVTIQKLDPYINIDPGTLNPYEHGECYVTEDGAVTDLDLGHYERFLNVYTSQQNSVTTGRIYQEVINKERSGDYLGKTVQVIPHVTDEIKRRIKLLGNSNKYDFIIVEIGGTVGDIESLPYIETVRQLRWELKQQCINVHLTLVPYLAASGELKTKPTQHSVKLLLEAGVQPDILVLRTEHPLNSDIKNKVANFCNVNKDAVIESRDLKTIYEVPIEMQKEKLDEIILQHFNLPVETEPNLDAWKQFLYKYKNPKHFITIALVGKYVDLKDTYKSINEAIVHSGAANETQINLKYVHSEKLNENNYIEELQNCDGILVPPGVGTRGINGKILAAKFARENNIPYLGICLGMQCAIIEYAQNVLKLEDANSIEINMTCKNPIISLMEEYKLTSQKSCTMRQGAYSCKISKGSKVYEAYQTTKISERHRHRYELNLQYKEMLSQAGMICTGINPETNLVEIIEIPNHKWFVGVMFNPEFKSTVINPHPLFVNFVQTIITK